MKRQTLFAGKIRTQNIQDVFVRFISIFNFFQIFIFIYLNIVYSYKMVTCKNIYKIQHKKFNFIL